MHINVRKTAFTNQYGLGAGVDYKAGNVTDWPLEGGSLKLELHHPWAYVYVNLGLGDNATNFNISLTPELTNVTGKGTLCIDKLPVPIDIQDGTLASIQVVTGGASGSALYNCADIRFKKDAKKLDNCTSSNGVTLKTVKESSGNSTTGSGNSSTNGTGTGEDKKSDGVVVAGSSIALMTVAGLVSAFALGL